MLTNADAVASASSITLRRRLGTWTTSRCLTAVVVTEHERLHTRLHVAIDHGADREQSVKNLPFSDRTLHHVVGRRWVEDGHEGGGHQRQREPSENVVVTIVLALVALILEDHFVVITNRAAPSRPSYPATAIVAGAHG